MDVFKSVYFSIIAVSVVYFGYYVAYRTKFLDGVSSLSNKLVSFSLTIFLLFVLGYTLLASYLSVEFADLAHSQDANVRLAGLGAIAAAFGWYVQLIYSYHSRIYERSMSRIQFYEDRIKELEESFFEFYLKDRERFSIDSIETARFVRSHKFYIGDDGKVDALAKSYRNLCYDYTEILNSLSYEVNSEHINPILAERFLASALSWAFEEHKSLLTAAILDSPSSLRHLELRLRKWRIGDLRTRIKRATRMDDPLISREKARAALPWLIRAVFQR